MVTTLYSIIAPVFFFVCLLIKWGLNIQNCYKIAVVSSKGKYTLASELINKQLKGSCGESASEIEVSDSCNIFFVGGSDTKTINFDAPDELLEKTASLKHLLTDWL